MKVHDNYYVFSKVNDMLTALASTKTLGRARQVKKDHKKDYRDFVITNVGKEIPLKKFYIVKKSKLYNWASKNKWYLPKQLRADYKLPKAAPI